MVKTYQKSFEIASSEAVRVGGYTRASNLNQKHEETYKTLSEEGSAGAGGSCTSLIPVWYQYDTSMKPSLKPSMKPPSYCVLRKPYGARFKVENYLLGIV